MMTADPRPRDLQQLIQEFAAFGDHRTGEVGDQRTSAWLVAELRRAGIDAREQSFSFPHVEVADARLSWPDGLVTGLPLYDGAFTGPGGVSGPIVQDDGADVAGALVVRRGDPNEPGMFLGPKVAADLETLRSRGARGVILVAGDDRGAPVVRNAERIDAPLDLPVLQIAPRASDRLPPPGHTATLRIDARRSPAQATNVTATVPGRDPGAAPIVLMTPKSGWFSCAAERGGGLAVWLTVAAGVAGGRPPRRPLWLAATSGHELHHAGLEAYLAALPAAADSGHTWVHLGASIGAREGSPRLCASDTALQAAAEAALSAAGAAPRVALPVGQPGGGEARNIAERGGRFLSLLGGHRYFHSPNDTVDLAVDIDSVRCHAVAVAAVVTDLLEAPGS